MTLRAQEASAKGLEPRKIQYWVPLGHISPDLRRAVLIAEDDAFFQHEGVDFTQLRLSLKVDWARGSFSRGASTITQQLAKNLYLSPSKNPLRKFRELVITRRLEAELSKDRILELYLNVIEWGDGVYGAEAAAQRYYGKPASALDADEAAGLAAMIPNPRRINPRVDPRRYARAQRRVIWLMAHAGYLSRSGLGAEPPPLEPADEDEPPPPEPEAAPAAVPDTPRETSPESPASPVAPAEAPPPSSAPEPTPSPV